MQYLNISFTEIKSGKLERDASRKRLEKKIGGMEATILTSLTLIVETTSSIDSFSILRYFQSREVRGCALQYNDTICNDRLSTTDRMQKHVRLILFTIGFIVFQTTVVSFTSILNIVPDVLLIWIVYIAINHGQVPATVYGFAIGLVIDLVSGEFLGLSALCKTIAGFLAGYFFHENKIDLTLSNYRFLVIVGVISLVHNIVYFIIFTQGSSVGLLTAIVQFGIFSSMYTTVIAALPMFVYMRKPQLR
jgi:rod shape-determining protein MreD